MNLLSNQRSERFHQIIPVILDATHHLQLLQLLLHVLCYMQLEYLLTKKTFLLLLDGVSFSFWHLLPAQWLLICHGVIRLSALFQDVSSVCCGHIWLRRNIMNSTSCQLPRDWRSKKTLWETSTWKRRMYSQLLRDNGNGVYVVKRIFFHVVNFLRRKIQTVALDIIWV